MSDHQSPSPEAIPEALGPMLRDLPAALLESFLRMAESGETLPPHLFQEAVEQAPVAVSITDAHANIHYVNRAFEELTGYARGEVLGHNESILANGTTPREVYQELWNSIRHHQPWHGILVNRRQDGSEYLADLNVAPVMDAKGAISHYLGMHRDISKRHQLERRHGHQQLLLNTLLNAAPLLVALLDTAREVILTNAAYDRLKTELGGQEPFALIHQALEDQVGLQLAMACKRGEAFHNLEVRLDLSPPDSTTSHHRWYSCSGTWVCELSDEVSGYYSQPEDARPCLLLLANDISEKMRDAERAHLQQLRTALAEQQLSLVMRETLEAAVFQLRGPLNLIEAAQRMLDQGAADPTSLQRMLGEIQLAGRHTLAQMESALPNQELEGETRVNLNELLQEVIQLTTDRLLANGILVDWRPAPLLPSITGRIRELRVLFMNLADNAIHALELSRCAEREIRLTTKAQDGMILIEFIDNGIGISKEIRPRVFEPFYSGWRQRERQPNAGIGMGLTLAQEIASHQGGSLYIDEDFLGGCRIRVELAIAST